MVSGGLLWSPVVSVGLWWTLTDSPVFHSQLSEFCDALKDPLRNPKPNTIKLVHMDLPLHPGDKVHSVDVLLALAKQVKSLFITNVISVFVIIITHIIIIIIVVVVFVNYCRYYQHYIPCVQVSGDSEKTDTLKARMEEKFNLPKV